MASKHIIERDWTSHGYVCMAVVTDLGHRCGYVGVDRHHFLHGLEYSCSHRFLKPRYSSSNDTSPEACFEVHGGITFSGRLDEHPGLWFFGFDCAHLGDSPDPVYCPKFMLSVPSHGGIVRTLSYVADECEKLAEQLTDVMNGPVWIVDEVEL